MSLALALFASNPAVEGPVPEQPAADMPTRERPGYTCQCGTLALGMGGVLVAGGAGLSRVSAVGAGWEFNRMFYMPAAVVYPVGGAALWSGASVRAKYDAEHGFGTRRRIERAEKIGWGVAGVGGALALASTVAFLVWPTRPALPHEDDVWTTHYRAPQGRTFVGHLIPTGAFAFTTGMTVGIYGRRWRRTARHVEVQPVLSANGGGLFMRF